MELGVGFGELFAYSALGPDVDRLAPVQSLEAPAFYGDDSFVLQWVARWNGRRQNTWSLYETGCMIKTALIGRRLHAAGQYLRQLDNEQGGAHRCGVDEPRATVFTKVAVCSRYQ